MYNNPIDNKYTSKHLPWELKQSFAAGNNKTVTLKLERKIKNMKSRKFIEKILDPEKGQQLFNNLLNTTSSDC